MLSNATHNFPFWHRMCLYIVSIPQHFLHTFVKDAIFNTTYEMTCVTPSRTRIMVDLEKKVIILPQKNLTERNDDAI